MEIRKVREVEKVVGYRCDACGQDCYKHPDPKEYSTEHATFSASWGYHSDGKDGDYWESDFCEVCALKVKDFIEKEMGGKVRVMEDHYKREGKDYIVRNNITKAEIKEVLAQSSETKGKEIHWPTQEKAKELRPWVDKILEGIGVKKGAFISDKSSIGDFEVFFVEGGFDVVPIENRTTLKKLSEQLGVEVSFSDLLVDVADIMHKINSNNEEKAN
jgi:hypothetical protein